MSLLSAILYIMSAQANIITSCDLPNTPSYILTKFYRPTCPYSIKIIPVMDEIETLLKKENAGIVVRYKNCNECECKTDDKIITVPTLTIHKDGIEIDRYRGSADYTTYTDFIMKATKISKNIFSKKIYSKPGEVLILKDFDFDNGVTGPWIVYFYDHKDHKVLTNLEELSKEFDGKLNFGRINVTKNSAVIKRFNIQRYPLIMGIYDDVQEPLHSVPSLENIKILSNLLIKPDLEPLSKDKFIEITKTSRNPVFIVLHTGFDILEEYFKKIAHVYKFRTKIWQSDDNELFSYLNAHPKEASNEEKIKDRDRLILLVYKEGELHEYKGSLEENDISDWIFHSHFPHLTKIRNDTFYTLFRGFTPILLMVSRAEEFVSNLEVLANKQQAGQPFGKYIFASLDTDAYPMFVESLLKGLKTPFVVIFNPVRQLFYHIPGRLKESNFESSVINLMNKYETGRLKPYPVKQKKWVILGVLFIFLSLCGLLFARFRLKKHIE